MSTNISVSVALESLRRLNQAQINANRQSHLLQVQRQGQAQKAVDAQAQGQAAEGRNLRGQLLYGIRSNRPLLRPEPFAVYRPGVPTPPATEGGWLLVPTDSDFNAIVAGLAPFQFTEAYLQDPSDRNSSHLSQFSAAGPSGQNCIKTSTTATGNPTFGNKVYSSSLFADTSIVTEPLIGEFTFEVIAKMDVFSDVDTSTQYEFSSADTTALFGFCTIRFIYTWQRTSFSPSTYALMGNVFMGSYLASSYRAFGSAAASYPAADVKPELNTADQWHHAAIVQRKGAGGVGREASFYLNGQLVQQSTGLPDDCLSGWLAANSGVGTDAIVTLAYGDTNTSTLNSSSSSIHGIRYTPRALYTGTSFTPPTSITSLA